MAVSRAQIVDQNFVAHVRGLEAAAGRRDPGELVSSELTARQAIEIFESMIASRHLDLEARNLKARNASFYTIGSSGHEGNAAVAAALRPDDMAFLHYRSGGFFVERARQVPGTTPLMDVLLGIVASTDEPIAGGRHKVFGSKALQIPPQTSTIASQLPKAVGAAFFLDRAAFLGLPTPVAEDAIVVVSFGDASTNHSTACGAFNAAAWARHQHMPCPILFLCEDNGIGISVRTPTNWIRERFEAHPHLRYFAADGLDVAATYDATVEAARYVRGQRAPAFLHLSLVRLLGHAGSDVEQSYRTVDEIEATEARDPLVRTASWMVAEGILEPGEIEAIYEDVRIRVARIGAEATKRPRARTRAEVIAPLAPRHDDRVLTEARAAGSPEGKPRHLAVLINQALAELLQKYPQAFLFGEDVAKKGGVYHVTSDLERAAGKARVFNTLLDEQAILGLAIGAGHMGQLPIPEIQYLAYVHNAIDQLRGEAGSLQFFSNGQFRNPMVVRIAGLAYQKGFGGHFHNDNSVASLRDIPGLVIGCPSNGRDAVGILRTAMAAAHVDGAVVVFLEPIALYMTKDLHEDKDGLWSFGYPEPEWTVPIGRAHTWGDGTDLTIVSYANGLWMSLRVARKLEAEGIRARVVDLRWLNPLPEADLVREAEATGHVLVVDECRRTGGMAEAVITCLVEKAPHVALARVTGEDTYVPLGPAADLVLVQEAEIERAARAMVEQARPRSRASS
jgi:2-oxoisovalerate dehydrogenase E1 component